MTHLYRTWLATFVQRWHTDPDLSKSGDSIAGHQCRVALLAAQLMPTISKEALLHALTHDLGEWFTGDISSPTKLTQPALKKMVDTIEEEGRRSLGFTDSVITEEEAALLKLCDRLDAFMWRLKHLPTSISRVVHEQTVESLLNSALNINESIRAQVFNIIKAIEEEYLPK